MPMQQDEEHLNLLAIFFYVVGGITGLFACMPVFHLVFGVMIIVAPEKFAEGQGGPPPEFFGYMIAVMGGLFILLGWATAISIFLTGRFISKRTHWLFCVVVSGIACMFMPFGTVLGIFALIVLNRPSVRELFESGGGMPTENGGIFT